MNSGIERIVDCVWLDWSKYVTGGRSSEFRYFLVADWRNRERPWASDHRWRGFLVVVEVRMGNVHGRVRTWVQRRRGNAAGAIRSMVGDSRSDQHAEKKTSTGRTHDDSDIIGGSVGGIGGH